MIGSLRSSTTAGRALLASAPILVVALAACGSSGSGTSANGGSTAGGAGASGAAPTSPAGSGTGGQRQPPGVSGQTADVSGDTLQVRTADGQTAVQFTSATKITEQKAATVAAVKVGACVVIVGPPDAAGTGLTAQTVAVTPVASGQTCGADIAGGGGRGGFGGGNGGGGTGGGGFRTRTAPPSGQGAGGPNGAPTTPMSTAFGTVTAVTPTSLTLQGRLRTFARGPQGGAPGASPSASPALSAVTVALAATTRFTDTVTVTSAALAVGQCVSALGQSNDIGAIAANSITIRPPAADGTCNGGFGFGGFGGRRGGASGSAAASSGTSNG